MNKNTLLLIIDPQNDFCQPNGALYIPDAENDMIRIAEFISKNQSTINHIIVSQDTHHVIDISHPAFWYDVDGNYPTPFTAITLGDVNEGKWKPRYESERAIEYLKKLEEQGEFPHVIWPEHCIVGSTGASIVDNLMAELKSWERNIGTRFEVVTKGLNPYTEMFGIFRANIPDPNDVSTMENKLLISQIGEFDTIIISGEARSHCLANTVMQLLPYSQIMEKIILLEDTMSNVTGFETIADPIYEQAIGMGAKFIKSKELILS